MQPAGRALPCRRHYGKRCAEAVEIRAKLELQLQAEQAFATIFRRLVSRLPRKRVPIPDAVKDALLGKPARPSTQTWLIQSKRKKNRLRKKKEPRAAGLGSFGRHSYAVAYGKLT
jgi:hypothetical protein